MTRAAWAVAAAAGISLAAGVGCYSPPQYAQPYGYPAAPAYPAAPGGYIVPGNAAPGTLGAPTTIPGGSGPTLAPPVGGDAPPYNTFEGGSAAPAGPTVPDYGDPQPSDFDSGSGGFGADPGTPAGGTTQPPDDGFQPPATPSDTPFMEGAVPRRLDIQQAAAPRPGKRDYFAGVDQADPASSTEIVATGSGVRPAAFEERPAVSEDFGFDPVTTPDAASATAPEVGEDGFGYERSAYGWLRGVVDYDPTSRTWHIIYGLTPDPADPYGGSLTLADNGRLAEFQDNDVVMVEGRPDPAAGRDALNKPVYRVTKAELLGRFE